MASTSHGAGRATVTGGAARQRRIMEALAAEEEPLTIRQIAPMVGLSSASTVQTHLANLARLGLVRRVVGWELTETGVMAVADGERR